MNRPGVYPPIRRRVLLGAFGAWGTMGAAPLWAATGTEPVEPALPGALSRPALMTPKALGTAQLAVTRAGQRLVSVGERGTVLLSDDHGQQWRQAQVPVQTTLTAVSFVNERTGWAAGHAGVVLRTDDGGAKWQLQLDGRRAARLVLAAAQAQRDAQALSQARQLVAEGADKPWFDLRFVDERRGYVVGAYNLFLTTEDGGASWVSQGHRLPNPKSLHLYGLAQVGEHLVIVGEQGLVLRADRGGAGAFVAVPSPYRGSFFGVVEAAPQLLVAFGLRGSAYRSTDAGATWQQVATDTPVTISAGAALPGGRYVLASQAGAVLLGLAGHGGAARTVSHSPVPVSGMAVASDGSVVLATLRGLRRLTGGLTA